MTSGALRILLVPALGLALQSMALAECKLIEMLTLPVTMNGRQPQLPAKINGHDVQFVLDSGSFFSSLSLDTARQLDLKLRPLPFGMQGVGLGGPTGYNRIASVDTLTIDGRPLRGMEFIVGGHFGQSGPVGLLGQNFLRGFDLDYDLANGVLRLMHPDGECSDTALAYWAGSKPYSVVDLWITSRRNPHSRIGAELNGHRVIAELDTGSPISIVDVEAAKRAGITRDSPGAAPADAVGGLSGRRICTWTARFDSFQIGGEKISNTRFRVGSLEPIDIDMLIGADFFLAHRVYVSNLQHKLYFTYNGGPVFAIPAKAAIPDAAASRAELPDADAYARRGSASAARGDLDGAIADLGRAADLAPDQAKYLILRADLRIRTGDRESAKTDLDQAVRLRPEAADVRVTRAWLQIESGQFDAAIADLDAAIKYSAKDHENHFRIAALYIDSGRPEPAIGIYSEWFESHADEANRAAALNGRCCARALLGRELDAARVDCDQALKGYPDSPEFLDSRGLVRLRQGDYDGAIGDYDRALKEQPDLAWSLYGRGLSKLRKGRTVEAQADLDAAKAADPKIAEAAARYGITP